MWKYSNSISKFGAFNLKFSKNLYFWENAIEFHEFYWEDFEHLNVLLTSKIRTLKVNIFFQSSEE